VIHRRAVAVLVLFAVALAIAGVDAGPAFAQRATAPEQGEEAKDELVSLDFDGEITGLIDLMARKTNRNFIYDDRVRGRVTVVSPTPIPIDQAYAVFESVLQVKGFTTVTTPGGALKVIPLRDAKTTNVDTRASSYRPPNRDHFVTRLIPLHYIEAEPVVNTLKPLISKDAAMAAYQPTNTVILTESSSNIRRIIAILEAIDVDTYQDEIAVIQVEYADASVLASQLSEIYGAEAPARTGTSRRSSRRRGGTTKPATPQATGTSPLGRVRLLTDDRTNSLIALAPKTQLEEVRALVRKLDVPVTGGGEIHVYYLQHADAEELSQTLSSLVTGTPRARSGGAPTAPGGAGGSAQAIRTAVTALAEGVRVTADPATNSLVIQARKEGYDALVRVIKLLDVERPQVLVEALIMEADVTDSSELGFDGIYRLVTDDLEITLASLSDAAARGAVAGATGIDPATLEAIGSAFAGGFGVGDEDSGSSIKGIIRATANNSGINIISAPHILTSDNEEAEIRIGDNIPIVSSRVQSAAGLEVGLSTSVNVERQDIGVTLRVTPQITEGDSLRLEIFQEITDVNEALTNVTGSAAEVGVALSNRRIENTVVVNDGDTVVVGGLISDRYVDTVSKVPFFGDIPILGWAFKTKIRLLRKVNLLVFLTPHIVRSPSQMEYASIRKREEFVDRTGPTLDIPKEDRWEAEERWIDSAITGGPYEIEEGPGPVRNRVVELAGKHPLERMQEIEQAERDERQRQRAAEEAARHAPRYMLEAAMGNDELAATDLLVGLVDAGYEGQLVTREVGGSLLLEIRVGPYPSLAEAREAGAVIGRAYDVPLRVVVVPREGP
jgi:general secretion pathway protein D